MKNKPLVSIIMNCYNCEKYLKEAIDSVINQTYQNWELIFWDNQSTDNSAKIVKFYGDNRIRYFYAPEFKPLGEARNLAINKAQGEWIAFLDSDDKWDTNKLSIAFETLQNKKNISLIYSKSILIDENNKEIMRYDKVMSGNIYDELLIKGDFIVFSSIIVKADILKNSGKINESLNYCEDYELLLKVTKDYEAIGIDEYHTYYRMHSNNITSTKVYENSIEVVEMLNNYSINNKISFYVKLNIFFNNSYRIGSLFMKLLINKEFKKIKFIFKEYFLYLLAFPMAIIKVKV